MRNRYQRSGALIGAGCAAWLALVAINVSIGAWAMQYVIGFWSLYALHVAKHVPYLPAAIGGLFLGEVVIPAAIGTWILSFIL